MSALKNRVKAENVAKPLSAGSEKAWIHVCSGQDAIK